MTITPDFGRATTRFALVLGCFALLTGIGGMGTAHAMSADSSGYAVVLPWLVATSFGNSTVSVENHSSVTMPLLVHYVGEKTSANPVLLRCGEQYLAPGAAQTFRLEVPADGVLRFDLRALLEQKCKGAKPPGTNGDRGTLTVFASGKSAGRISALARVTSNTGLAAYGQEAIPLGALEGNTQVVAGLRSEPGLRTDCLIGSLDDATGSGNLYRLTLKDPRGVVLGKTAFALHSWSAELLVDVFALVGVPGLVVDGARAEIEPTANPTRPALVSSCRVIRLANSDTLLRVGRVYEPLDLLRQRTVRVSTTPGVGDFVFDPARGRQLHVMFLRAPDLVECAVDDARLIVIVRAPDGHFVAGGFTSTLEFFTGHRGAVNSGDAGAWGIEVEENPMNPPTAPVVYRLTCTAGNGVSQLDLISP